MTDTLPLGAGYQTFRAIYLTVRGKPAPQGSMEAFRNKHTGRIQQVESNKTTLLPWRFLVKTAAEDAVRGSPRLAGPVHVELAFTFDKPASAPKRRRIWPVKRSTFDLDKLCRGVFDALTDAGVWYDDAQVVSLSATKVYAGDDYRALDAPGARITVVPLGGET